MTAHEQRKYPRLKPPNSVVVAWQSGMQRGVSYVESLGAWRDAVADEDDDTAAEFGDYSAGYAGGAGARAGDCAADS
jgi:hypothetical protein